MTAVETETWFYKRSVTRSARCTYYCLNGKLCEAPIQILSYDNCTALAEASSIANQTLTDIVTLVYTTLV
jgi:hypothetical protein